MTRWTLAVTLALIVVLAWPLLRWAAIELHSTFGVGGVDLAMLVAFFVGPVTVLVRGERRSS